MAKNEDIVIDPDRLVDILKVIVRHIKDHNEGPLRISDDYYWEVVKEQLYDPLQDPSKFTLGQLTDDWERLQLIMNGDLPPIGYALTWLSSVLRVLGQKNVA